jgi:hypothetical protein
LIKHSHAARLRAGSRRASRNIIVDSKPSEEPRRFAVDVVAA